MKLKKTTISVALATFNEEKNIARCLDSLRGWVNEIIIVDGESSDSTVNIAQKYPKTKIIVTTNKPIFHINKQLAIDNCQSDWILQLDADEVVTPQLAAEIQRIIKKTKYSGFWIKRRNYFLGNFLKKGGQYPDPTIRLYQKGKGRLPCLDVHEQAEITGPVGWLKNDLLHYADPTFSRYLTRSNRYTTLLAQELLNSGLKPSWISGLNYFLIKPLWWFFLSFFRHRGYVDGFPGFVFSLFSSLRFPIAYIKFWEVKNSSQTLDQKWE